MGCNLKAGVISIAVITIVFASLQLCKSGHDLITQRHGGHHKDNENGLHDDVRHHEHRHHHHKHHEDHKKGDQFPSAEPELLDNELKERNEDLQFKESMKKEHKDEPTEKSNSRIGILSGRRATRCGAIVSIVLDVIAIIVSSLVFVATSSDIAKNQRRRHFLLPFIVWNIIQIILMIAGTIFLLIVLHEYIQYLAIPLVIIAIIIAVTTLFIHLTVKYFKSLTIGGKGFDYAQMQDDIKKQPLA